MIVTSNNVIGTTEGVYADGFQVNREWINARLTEYSQQYTTNDASAKSLALEAEARRTLPFFQRQLAVEAARSRRSRRELKALPEEPLGPEDFLNQEGILHALGLLENSHSRHTTDSLSLIFRDKNWKWYENFDARATRQSAVLLGWQAFVSMSTKNMYGVYRSEDGSYLPGSCLQKLAALSVAAINDVDGDLAESQVAQVFNEYNKLVATFPGLALPQLVEAVEAYFLSEFMKDWALNLDGYGDSIPTYLLDLDTLTEAVEKKMLSDEDVSILADLHDQLCTAFVGLELSGLMDAIESSYPQLLEISESSSDEDSNSDVSDFELSFEEEFPADNSEQAVHAYAARSLVDSAEPNADADDSELLLYDCESPDTEVSVYYCDNVADFYFACLRNVDLCCIYEFERWEELKTYLQAEAEMRAEAAANFCVSSNEEEGKFSQDNGYPEELKSLGVHLSQQQYFDPSEELADLEMYLSQEQDPNSPVYCEHWPQGDAIAVDAVQKTISILASADLNVQVINVPSPEKFLFEACVHLPAEDGGALFLDVDAAQQQQHAAEDETAVETSDYDVSFLPDDLFAEEEGEEPLQAPAGVVADVVKMVSSPAAGTYSTISTADEVQYESSVQEESSESISVADAAANSSAFALSSKEIEAGGKIEICVCCVAPVAKGDSIDTCLTCSDCGSYCSWSSRDADEWIASSMPWEEEVEEEVQVHVPAAAAAAPSKKKKKNIFKKAGKAVFKASKAAGRTFCRGMKAVLLPNPSLAYCLIGVSPVME